MKSNLKAEAPIKTSCIYADSAQSGEHKAPTAMPLSLTSGEARAAEGKDLDLQTAFFLRNHKRSNPPHHYPSRNLQRSSAASVLLGHRGATRDLTHLSPLMWEVGL